VPRRAVRSKNYVVSQSTDDRLVALIGVRKCGGPTPPRVRMSLAVMMLVFLLIPALALYRELSRRSDIWWTPQALLVPLSESSDRVEVYVRGKRLISLLPAGQLRTTGDRARDGLSSRHS